MAVTSKYTIAQGYIQILPSTKGFGAALKGETDTESEKAGESAGHKFGSGMKTGLKVAGAALTAASAAIGKITKDVISYYGEYEQLVGGVQKLFGEMDYQKVVDNASQAFKTAGMSANDYMETVTGFSASLINSLEGDTEAAVKYADLAITDMSDNANTFGTDISSIQYAYQGFAKQNYTMLDNLKLGYGGTKTEMERLIEDANRVKEANGGMADLSIESFADVVEAIHIMQEQMGIAGTTAKEAEGTIEGSLNTMKAAWENLLTGMGDSNADIKKLTKDFTDAFENVVTNLKPVIRNISAALPEALGSIMDVAAEVLPDLIVELLPAAVSGLVKLAAGLVTHVPEIVSGLVEGLFDGISEVITGKKTGWFSVAEEYADEIDALEGKLSNLTSAVNNTNAAYDNSIASTEANAATATYLKDKIFELIGAEEQTAGQKALIKTLVDELNGIVPGLGLAYDEEKNSLNLLNSEIESNIENMKQQAQVAALQDLYTESTKNAYLAQMELSEAVGVVGDILDDYGLTQEAGIEIMNRWNEGPIAGLEIMRKYGLGIDDMLVLHEALGEAYDNVAVAQENLNEATEKTAWAEEQLGIKFDEVYSSVVPSMEDLNAQWQETFGTDMPAALQEAITAATNAGVSIPDELQTGISNGSVDVDAAISNLNDLVQFQEAVNTANEAGAKIPQDQAQELYASMGSVEKAIAALNALVIFKTAIAQAKKDGINIDDGLVKGIMNASGLSAIYNAADDAGQKAIDGIKAGSGVASPSWKADAAGQNVLAGLYNGLNNGGYRSSIFSTMWSLGQSIISSVKSAMGIHSPSKYAMEIGGYFMEGLQIGMEKEEDSVTDSAAAITNNMVGSAMQVIEDVNRAAEESALDGSVFMRSDISRQVTGSLTAVMDTRSAGGTAEIAAYLPQILDAIDRIAKMKMVTDRGALVGELAELMDNEFASIKLMQERG